MLFVDACPVRPARAIAVVGTYPPTECGIATFTSNVRSAILGAYPGWSVDVLEVAEVYEPGRDSAARTWLMRSRQSLEEAQRFLNGCDAVLLQHEFGIFAGADGDEVLELIDGVRVPLIAVLHTALAHPSVHQREVLDAVIFRADSVIVQSNAARGRILSVHDVDPDKVVVIQHGAAANFSGPRSPHVTPPSVLTWGLLSPGKGIEHGIAAVARLWPRIPSLSYWVSGRTHPKVLAQHGESYRDSLRALAEMQGARGRVRFDDGYHDQAALRTLVRSADVVLLPYESPDQVSSGVLVEALASGKPVVATKFPHALELLSDGAGILVEHGDADAMAAAIERILCQPGLAHQMAERARAVGESLLWPVAGASYGALLERIAREQVAR